MDSAVKFVSRGQGYGLFLTSTEAVLALSKKHKAEATPRELSRLESRQVENPKSTVVRMQLLGTNAAVSEPEGVDELPGRVNYFIGSDPGKWRTDVPTYAKVGYRQVYAGIDLIYYGSGRQVEYDFEIAPGADPGAIRFGFKGDEQVRIDGDGDLVVQDEGGEVRLLKPVAYQRVGGVQQEVAAEYALLDQGEVVFKVGHYNNRESLVIDPVLSYSTFLGGSMSDVSEGIAVDGTGNAYVTGATRSSDFPTVNPLQPNIGGNCCGAFYDAFVSKLNATGTALVYSTYLGGACDDGGAGIAVDGSGNAYVMGWTSSPNFPTVNPLQPNGGVSRCDFPPGAPFVFDAFVAKLNASGTALQYSTYLGGSGREVQTCPSNECANFPVGGIAVDGLGNAYVTGYTSSTDFPTASPLQPANGGGTDAFVAKLNASGSALLYSTYLGGNSGDFASGIAVDGSGNAYVTGWTSSTNFPTASPLQPALAGGSDAFVAKLNAAGSALLYSTYLGGSGSEAEFLSSTGRIAVDGSGNAYVTGVTSSRDFPTVNPLQPALAGFLDTFVAKLNAAGSALLYSTYLGGSVRGGSGIFGDYSFGIAVDGSGNAYVIGMTESLDFPTVSPLQPNYGGGTFDAFVSKLNAAGSALLYSTYLGGSSFDGGGGGIAVDGSGNAYVFGNTDSVNFPGVPLPGSGFGTFVAKIIGDTFCVTNLQGRGTAAGRAPARVDLTWSLTGADSYDIMRGTASGGPYTLVGSSLTNVFSDSTVSSGGLYYYVLQSRSNSGGVCLSNEATVPVPNAR